MHKGEKVPSFLSRHRVFLAASIFWAIFWSIIIYVFYRFPYALDIFHLNASTASITEIAIVGVLIGFGLVASATLLDAFVRDRKRVRNIITPRPVVSDALFTNKNLTR